MKKFLLLTGVFIATFSNNSKAEEITYYRPEYQNKNTEYIIYTQQTERPKQYRTVQELMGNHKAQPYIGIDVSKTKLEFGDSDIVRFGNTEFFKDKNKTASFVFGARIAPTVGAEVFFQQSDKSDNYLGDSLVVSPQYSLEYIAYGADFQFYVPLKEKLEMIFSLGVANYDFKLKGKINSAYQTITAKEDFDSLGWRYGIGLEYALNKNLHLRGLVRYINTDDEYIKNMTELSLGLRYLF